MNLSDIWGAKEDKPVEEARSITTLEEVVYNEKLRLIELIEKYLFAIHTRINQIDEAMKATSQKLISEADMQLGFNLSCAGYTAVCGLNRSLFLDDPEEFKRLEIAAQIVEKSDVQMVIEWLEIRSRDEMR